MKWSIFIALSCLINLVTSAATWHIGPNRLYKTCDQVTALIADGDSVLIDAGLYIDVKQVTWRKNYLYIGGFQGKPRLEAGAKIANDASNGKGIFVIAGTNCIIENIEFANAKVMDNNGAGIRQEGANVIVRHCVFTANEMGLLCGVIADCKITMEHNIFQNNGSTANPGYQHNVYIGHIDTFLFQYNESIDAIAEGHELKSRAKFNFILYNRIANYQTEDSRTIDLPNGGVSIIMGNIIEQGINSANNNIIGYGLEGLSNPVAHELYLVNNTIINKKSKGNYIQIQNGTTRLFLKNNVMAGANTGGLIIGNATLLDSANNVYYPNINDCGFIDPNTYNYQLQSNSALIDRGVSINNVVSGIRLTPDYIYSDKANFKKRKQQNNMDIGAYEFIINTNQKEFPPNKLSIYPNPCNDYIQIHNATNSDQVLVFYNTNGNEIMRHTITASCNNLSIDISHFYSGIYYMSNSGKKIILQKN